MKNRRFWPVGVVCVILNRRLNAVAAGSAPVSVRVVVCRHPGRPGGGGSGLVFIRFPRVFIAWHAVARGIFLLLLLLPT